MSPHLTFTAIIKIFFYKFSINICSVVSVLSVDFSHMEILGSKAATGT